MHGLVNRSVQSFLSDTYGVALWSAVSARIGVSESGFEAMLSYEDITTEAMLAEAGRRLGQEPEALLEDLGTYLVSHPRMERLRRLLRFGGTNFLEFLQSLEDMPERGRLAVPDLELPDLEVADEGAGHFLLHVRGGPPGSPAILTGVLRAMADDYGALAVIEMVQDTDRLWTGGGIAPDAGALTEPVPSRLSEAGTAAGVGLSGRTGGDAASADACPIGAAFAGGTDAADPFGFCSGTGAAAWADALPPCGTIRIVLHDPEFSKGRHFDLAFSRPV